MATFNLSVSASLGLQPVTSGYVTPIRLSVSAGLGLGVSASVSVRRTIALRVSAGVGLQPAASLAVLRTYRLTVSAGVGLQPAASLVRSSTYRLTVSASVGLQPVASLAALRTYHLSVSASLGLQPALPILAPTSVHKATVSSGLGLQASLRLNSIRGFTVAAGLGLQPTVSTTAIRRFSVSAGLGLHPTAGAYRIITLSVSAGLGLQPAAGQGTGIHGFTLTVGLGFHPTVTATVGTRVVAVTLSLGAAVACQLIAAPGVGIPGVSSVGGPSAPLFSGISGTYPFTFAETSGGVVLMANGVDPMVRWDAMAGGADLAGIQAPAAAPAGTVSGLGTITGLRYLFVRFLDAYGNPSNLSPAGVVQCGFDLSIDNIASNAASGLVTIESRGHGLTSGTAVLLQGITGLPLNGPVTITVTDPDHFTVNGVSLAGGIWTGGGAIVVGAASLTYRAIPAPSQARASRIQLLRNLEGNLDVIYVEATISAISTTYTAALADEQLAQQQAVVLRTEEGLPLGLRYAVPPSNRPFIVNYMGRIFAAGDVAITTGNAQVVNGSNQVQGWGTQWIASLLGRSFYVKGASRSYGIASVNSSTQVISLETAWSDASSLFATYSIRSSPSDRKMLQWSEPDLPEAWPPWNAMALPEDNDEIVGLFVRGTYLYIAERRHLWRFQFSGDPARGGHVFMQASRGAINQRCIAATEDGVYILDESGVYRFDGAGVEDLGEDVQSIWWSDGQAPTFQIDWSADTTLWHAAVDPPRTIVRWFVAVQGAVGLTMALCFNYRLKRWWWEQYPVQLTSSCTGTLSEAANVGLPGGSRRALAGSDCRVVLVLGEGALDLVADSGTLRGSVASATSTTLSDSAASFAAYLAGAPVTIVSGSAAAGQTRIISASSGNALTVVQAWTTIPLAGDVYQIGGVSWEWRSGWLDVEDEEGDTTRDLVVSFQTVTTPAMMSMQLYYDHAASPMAWGYSQTLDGVTVTAGSPVVAYDLSSTDVLPGYRVLRIARHSERYAYSDRFVQMFMSGVANDQVVRVYQVSLRGVDQEGV